MTVPIAFGGVVTVRRRGTRRGAGSAAGIAVLGLGLGCAHGATPTLAPPAVEVAPVRPGAAQPAEPSALPARRAVPRTGCLADAPDSGSTRELLAALKVRCSSGMSDLTGGAAGRPPDEELPPTSIELFFDIADSGRGVRFLAVGDASMSAVELLLFSANRDVIARGESFGRVALLPAEGTLDLDPGRYSALARTATGEGELALNGFVTE